VLKRERDRDGDMDGDRDRDRGGDRDRERDGVREDPSQSSNTPYKIERESYGESSLFVPFTPQGEL
jgi:hypothetical protein